MRIKQTDCRKPSELNHSDDGDDDGVDVACGPHSVLK